MSGDRDIVIPTATYRLQVCPSFAFQDTVRILDYLAELGVSHVYLSPCLQAIGGSTHGYDVADHRKVNRELGGEESYLELCRQLKARGLGQVLDIVPNHMAITTHENELWWDVLENGRLSPWAFYFDIDWASNEPNLAGKVLLPVLGDHYGRVLERGELSVRRDNHAFIITYMDHRFPVSPDAVGTILSAVGVALNSAELLFLADALSSLPRSTHEATQNPGGMASSSRPCLGSENTDMASKTMPCHPDDVTSHAGARDLGRRADDLHVLKSILTRFFQENAKAPAVVDRVLEDISASPDALDSLLNAQNYRLAFWRTAARKLNYRRFFNISTLIGLAVENEEVLRETHRLIFRWVDQGLLDGLRVDHPDGLRDPAEYLVRLRERAPKAWIAVEKILEPGEALRQDWPVHGTTGYDFLNAVNGLFVDPAGERPLTDLYASFTGQSADYPKVVHAKKHVVLKLYFGGEINRLSGQLIQIAERHRCYRDFGRHELEEGLKELVAAFPVYRTYVRAEQGEVAPDDVRYIDEAVAQAKQNRPDLDQRLFDFMRKLLVLEIRGDLESDFAMRFQQFTGPATAKGVEDTTFYCYNRFISLNEVGGDPSKFGVLPDEFHAYCRDRQAHWPETMLGSSTHDTKRSEDVRARLNVLSEMPDRWTEAVEHWRAMNEKYRRGPWPDRNIEYFLYQTLVGAWPLPAERAVSYMSKASNEAKMYTSWVDPNVEYDRTLEAFIRAILTDEEFARDLEAFVKPLLVPGWINALSQTLIKLTAPGVPDIYQGNEIWDRSLVDPDNRRAVDFEIRRRLLAELPKLTVEDVWARAEEGLPKLYLTQKVLHFRKRNPEMFGREASYEPLAIEGDKADHLVAFGRGGQVIILVPRLVLGLNNDWAHTTVTLPEGSWQNLLADEAVQGREVNPADVFKRFPVALLARSA